MGFEKWAQGEVRSNVGVTQNQMGMSLQIIVQVGFGLLVATDINSAGLGAADIISGRFQ